LLLLACSLATAAQAQRPPSRHAQVGAGDIFTALTQPDRAAEMEALHALSDALSGTPDPAKLEAARAKLADVLQVEERHQADMPPALVMSGIASRIEAALAGLEEARRAPPPAPDRPQAFLVPGLAALSAALTVALIACVAGLAARGREAEAQEDLQDTLKKIRRRLEGGAPAAAAGGLAQDMAGEASEAVQQATVAVDRLGSAARDAEGRLQTSVGDTEARLHAAATVAAQLEHWMDSLPERLAASVQAIGSHGLPGIEAAAARIEVSAEKIAGLQNLLADYGGAVSGLSAQAEQSAENLQRQVLAMHERFEALAGVLPERVAGALPAAMGELTSAADLLAELSNLAIGQTVRLEDIVARADKVAYDLPAVAQLLEAASAHLLGQIDQDAGSSAAAGQVAEDLAEMSRLAKAAADAMEGRLASGADRVQAQLEAAVAAVSEAVARQVAQAADAFGTRFAGRTELLQAALEQAALAVTNAAASLPEIGYGVREATAQLSGEVGGQAAALREAAASLAAESAALLEAARARATNDAASGAQEASSFDTMAGLAARLAAAEPALIGLQAATETVQRAAARLLESAQAQDAAMARAEEAAADVARIVAAPRPDAAEGPALAGLTGIASLAESLQGEAESLAACVLRGDTLRIPAELISQTPVMLAAIETSIHRLRGTATALALASDGRLKAA